MSGNAEDEIIIAQEQDAINRPIHLGFGKDIEGTLILTNKRLIFACGNEQVESFQTEISKEEPLSQKLKDEATNIGEDLLDEGGPLSYCEVEDLQNIPSDPRNIFIPISSVSSVSGHKGELGPPTLKVSWNDGDGVKATEFQEILTGPSRKKNLNDWAEVIEGLRSGKIPVPKLPTPPSKDTLEGKVAYVMGDMQDKGVLEIEEQVETQFKVELDPDDVEAACNTLVSIGFLEKIPDASEDTFYRKRSPIGIDDLSS